MIESTKLESREELDRFCDAMLSTYDEIGKIAKGIPDANDNLVKNTTHNAEMVMVDE